MIIVALMAAVLAALLVTPRGSDPLRRLARRVESEPRPRRFWWWTVPAAAAPVAAWVAGGTTGAVLTLSGVIIILTVGRLAGSWRRGRQADRYAAEVARACSVLAGQCRVGLVPAEALRTTSVDHPVLAEAVAVGELGGDVPALWRRQSEGPGRHGLLALARAWQVSAQVGAPMADALEQVSRTLTEDRAVRTVVSGELAAPRATSRLLGGLPLFGVVLGVTLGGDPLDFLLRQPIGQGCLIGGVVLACAGLIWVDRLATGLGGTAR